MKMNPGIRKANREFMAEGYRQINLKIAGAGLALHRKWGYGTRRISTMMDELLRGWNECAKDPSASMLTMLEAETGIELAVPGEKSYHELIYLNGTPRGNLSEMQIIAMRRKQTKWIGTTILASVMLSMHRMYGFGADRDCPDEPDRRDRERVRRKRKQDSRGVEGRNRRGICAERSNSGMSIAGIAAAACIIATALAGVAAGILIAAAAAVYLCGRYMER